MRSGFQKFAKLCMATIAAVLAVGLVTAAPAQETIYGTLGSGDTFDTNTSISFGGGVLDGYADRFTSPVTADVGSVLLAIEAVSAGTDITLTIRSNSADGPGGIVGTFSPKMLPTDPGIVTFVSTSDFQLNAGTEYWLTAGGSSGQVNWFDNDQSIQNFTASHLEEDDSWMVEEVPGTALAFEVETVPEPGSPALCAAGLLVLCLSRRRRQD
jgi:hypothetical protein